MSIKPVDAQVMIHNAPDAAKIHNERINKGINIQAQSEQVMQEKIKQDTSKVVATEKSSNAKINKKPDRDKNNKDQKNKNKKDNQQSSSTIDIRI